LIKNGDDIMDIRGTVASWHIVSTIIAATISAAQTARIRKSIREHNRTSVSVMIVGGIIALFGTITIMIRAKKSAHFIEENNKMLKGIKRWGI
jgi:uncharacterized membrane protein YraQ (UPF0718 family)